MIWNGLSETTFMFTAMRYQPMDVATYRYMQERLHELLPPEKKCNEFSKNEKVLKTRYYSTSSWVA